MIMALPAVAGAASKIPAVNKLVNAVGSLKTTDNVLMRTRDKIFDLFKAAGYGPGSPALDNAVSKNKMAHAQVANQKIGSDYSEEWRRLYNMVIDTFTGMGRNDLATQFTATVPTYTTTVHPIDYIATLLKGASSKPVIQAAENTYSVLQPFKQAMVDALKSKGLTVPSSMEDLTQVFYNNFVAKKGTDYEELNFDEIPPSMDYHVDESVINAVVSYFTSLAQRKAEGEQLPKVLDKMATATEKVKTTIAEKAKEEVQKEIGGSIMDNKTIIIAAVVLLLLIIGALIMKRS